MAAKITTKYDNEIAQLKRKSGLSHKQLGALLGCSKNYVWMLCSGERPCPMAYREAIIAIARAATTEGLDNTTAQNSIDYWQTYYNHLTSYWGVDYTKWPEPASEALAAAE